MRQRVERGIAPLQRLPIAQVGGHAILQPDMIHVLAGFEPLKELDHPRVPAGDVARQLLQHGGRAFAPPVGDGVRHFGARADGARGHAVHRPVADQVADVRRHPLGAGLDELIVIELVEIFAQHGDLFSDALRTTLWSGPPCSASRTR